jgi:hypothetical protein
MTRPQTRSPHSETIGWLSRPQADIRPPSSQVHARQNAERKARQASTRKSLQSTTQRAQLAATSQHRRPPTAWRLATVWGRGLPEEIIRTSGNQTRCGDVRLSGPVRRIKVPSPEVRALRCRALRLKVSNQARGLQNFPKPQCMCNKPRPQIQSCDSDCMPPIELNC